MYYLRCLLSVMKKKYAVFTGSGISAESGIQTFRGAGGLWEGYRVEDVASPEAWRRDPALVTHFYNQRRVACANAMPNNAHKVLAELEKQHEVVVITQNVDDLHERAGSTGVLHLHGELMKMRSQVNPGLVKSAFEIYGSHEANLTQCCPHGKVWRPHIVWFGEEVPMMEEAIRQVQDAEVFVVIGTSLQVYPAASLLHFVPSGVPVYLIDPEANQLAPDKNIHRIPKTAVQGTRELMDLLLGGI